MTPDLTSWLLAQIAKDRRVAEAAAAGVTVGYSLNVPVGPTWQAERGMVTGADALWDCEGSSSLCMPSATAVHMATWDPARVLAECDAKERIVNLHHAETVDSRDPDGEEWTDVYCAECDATTTHPCGTLRLLALPYAARDGFREEWKV